MAYSSGATKIRYPGILAIAAVCVRARARVEPIIIPPASSGGPRGVRYIVIIMKQG